MIFTIENFINPTDPLGHTQTVDGLAGMLKVKLRGKRGVSARFFQEHLWFQAWRSACRRKAIDPFDSLLSIIAFNHKYREFCKGKYDYYHGISFYINTFIEKAILLNLFQLKTTNFPRKRKQNSMYFN